MTPDGRLACGEVNKLQSLSLRSIGLFLSILRSSRLDSAEKKKPTSLCEAGFVFVENIGVEPMTSTLPA